MKTEIILEAADGSMVGIFTGDMFPLKMTMDTTSATDKVYTLAINYKKENGKKNFDKPTGAQLS
jgi:hypothetical protein